MLPSPVQKKLQEVLNTFAVVFDKKGNRSDSSNGEVVLDNKNMIMDLNVTSSTSTGHGIMFKLSATSSGRYELDITANPLKINDLQLSVDKYCTERKQLVLSIYNTKIDDRHLLFIGKIAKHNTNICMIELNDSQMANTMAKLNEKLFNPSSGDDKVVSIVNPLVYILDEPNHYIQDMCSKGLDYLKRFEATDTTLIRFKMKNREQNNAITSEDAAGHAIENCIYTIPESNTSKYLKFEECYEYNVPVHMAPRQRGVTGYFGQYIYIRGHVRECGDKSNASTSSLDYFSSWKRLLILERRSMAWHKTFEY